MVDTGTEKPIRVQIDAVGGAYIKVSVNGLERLRKLLEDNAVRHWVDHYAVSVDGGPSMTMIYLHRKTDPTQVQALLDNAA
jgi:hypothetical protein